MFEMSVTAAIDYFTQPAIGPILARLQDVGLDYLALGQTLTSLSGGERQRLNLATELGTPGRTIILDEPTTGLHIADITRLLGLLDRITDVGSTLVVIEHNRDIIAAVDWIIDVGSEAGQAGGRIVYEGTTAQMLAERSTHTAEYLRRHCAP